VPQCWLAGFTDTGMKEGSIFVTDFKRGKQWRTTPDGCGHIRDYYRIPGPDPVMVEKTLSKIEGLAGPVFRQMFEDRRGPVVEEWDNLFDHIAVQYSRVPAFRPYILGLTDSIYRKTITEALTSLERRS